MDKYDFDFHSIKHFVNLTNGLQCCDASYNNPRYIRIQSSWLEQKRFEDVLVTASPDLMLALIYTRNQLPVVHDLSERPRYTRAQWQGLPWLRFALEKASGRVITPVIMNRNLSTHGHNATQYFHWQFDQLSDRAKKTVKYYNRFVQDEFIDYAVCRRGSILLQRASRGDNDG